MDKINSFCGNGRKTLKKQKITSYTRGLRLITFNFSKIILIFFLLSGTTTFAQLTCENVKTLIQDHFLRLHFSARTFDKQLSRAIVERYIKALDPGKFHFYQSEVDAFIKKYEDTLPGMIDKKDCSAIDEIFNLYSKRFKLLHEESRRLVQVKHDFKLDESLDIDRKKMPYPKDSKEASERLRGRVKLQLLSLKDSMSSYKKVKEKLIKRFIRYLKSHQELTKDDIFGIFLEAVSTSLDPHTSYISPTQLEDFQISTSLSLEGIGALLRSDEGITTVSSLVPGGAAQKSGKLKIRDKIVYVTQGDVTKPNQKKGEKIDIIDMDLREVVKLIRGTQGTTVTLTVRRDAKEFQVPITREKVELSDRAAKSKIHRIKVKSPNSMEQEYKIGVIDLSSFYIDFSGKQTQQKDFRSSSRDMLMELDKLKKEKIHGVILDLRSNGGGGLGEAINIAGLFSGKGPVVQTKGIADKAVVSTFDQEQFYDGPLAVIIDRQSASASEILAGAIQDYERGLIIGDDHTFGKGTVQSLEELDKKLGAIKVTVSMYYRPLGASTQLRGVESDIVLPSLSNQYEIGEKFYDSALPWSKVPAAPIKNYNLVKPYIKNLQDASVKRVNADAGFKEIFEEIKNYNAKLEERSKVSLKEKTKAEKLKEEKEIKDLEAKRAKWEDEYGNVVVPIEEDPTLKESLFITADYIRLLEKQALGESRIISDAKPKKEAVNNKIKR